MKKNKKILTAYRGKTNYNQVEYHLFSSYITNDNQEFRMIKVDIGHEVFTNLELNSNNKYELSWMEDAKQDIFNRNDTVKLKLVKELPEEETKIYPILGNVCFHCEQEIVKGENPIFYELDLGKNVSKFERQNNHRYCSDCSEAVREFCEKGNDKYDLRDNKFGSKTEKVFLCRGKVVDDSDNRYIKTLESSHRTWICPWCKEAFKSTTNAAEAIDHYSKLDGIHRKFPKKDNKEDERKESPPNQEPNKDSPNPKDNPSQLTEDRFASFCKDKKIKTIYFDDEKKELFIKYKGDRTETKQEGSLGDQERKELLEVIRYLKDNGKRAEDGRTYFNIDDYNRRNGLEQKPVNYLPWAIVGGTLVFILMLLVMILALVSISKKNNE